MKAKELKRVQKICYPCSVFNFVYVYTLILISLMLYIQDANVFIRLYSLKIGRLHGGTNIYILKNIIYFSFDDVYNVVLGKRFLRTVNPISNNFLHFLRFYEI